VVESAPLPVQNKDVKNPRPQGIVWKYISKHEDKPKNQMTLTCNLCPMKWHQTLEQWRSKGSSTSNQLKHLRKQHADRLDEGSSSVLGPMDSFASKKITSLSTSDDLKYGVSNDMIREALENFIIANCEPFSLIENEYFLTLLKLCLNCQQSGNVFIPKADALKNGIMKRVSVFSSQLADKLANQRAARFHFALDLWTSPNSFTFMAVTCHYINNDWEISEELLAFVDTLDHTGDGLAKLTFKVLQDFGLSSRVGCITGDNASNNDTLCSSLSNLLLPSSWDAVSNRIRCFAHVVNLSCQSFLSYFQSEAENEEDMETAPDASCKSVSNLLRRIRFFIKKLRASPQQRDNYNMQCLAAGNSSNMLILDVKTRWNSTFAMLKRLVEQKNAVNFWMGTNPKFGKIAIGYLKLSEEEWMLVNEMVNHLSIFDESTRLISGNSYPTLSLVMPAFIEMFTYIENQMKNSEVSLRIKEALTMSHKVLSKYYNFTDDSIFYIASVVLDPRFKVEYLELKGFNSLYPGLLKSVVIKLKTMTNELDETKPSTSSNISAGENNNEGSLLKRMFAHTESKSNAHELDTYLSLQTESAAVDPLQWWKSHEIQFPSLSKLARTVLAIPGSSVSVERVFNVGRDMIGLRRHALGSDSTSSLMLCHHYLRK
jgi:hypothetical protein